MALAPDIMASPWSSILSFKGLFGESENSSLSPTTHSVGSFLRSQTLFTINVTWSSFSDVVLIIWFSFNRKILPTIAATTDRLSLVHHSTVPLL